MLQTRTEKRNSGSLKGTTLFVPRMCYGSAKLFCAAFQAVGVDAQLSPKSNEKTLELGSRYLSGEECYPAKITLGSFFSVMESNEFNPGKTAFFMPTAAGPCRFGQYAFLIKNILKERGIEGARIFSPTSDNGYREVDDGTGLSFARTTWRALVAGDILRKLLLKTRPYELNKGQTDEVYENSLNKLYKVIAKGAKSERAQLINMADELIDIRQEFRKIPADYTKNKPLVGIVGEIFCRLNNFSNEDLIRKIEELGGEAWLSDISEWIWYTNDEHRRKLITEGKSISFSMLGTKLKHFFQRRDEYKLLFPFMVDFKGYEEPHDIREVLKMSFPYLPYIGSLGEMVLSVGKAIYLHKKGADGIIDISPFTCMNGIISEAVYPVVSRDNDNMPIRNFYFDGTQLDLDRDVGIFLELAKGYQAKKKIKRVYPRIFNIRKCGNA